MALQTVLTGLAADDAVRRVFARRARQRARSFTAAATTQRYLALYRKMLEPAGAGLAKSAAASS